MRKIVPIVLASSSAIRKKLLENAGLTFTVSSPTIDERMIEGPLEAQGARPDETARVLAEAKALDVSSKFPDHLVIGSDQTMSVGERVYHKPKSMAEARDHLLSFSGQDHYLNSAVALVKNGAILWTHTSSAKLSVRHLTAEFVDRHLEQVGDRALQSVGGYQLEGIGLQLFEAIDGDYFTILGLPMLPLLKILRELDAIDG